MVSCQLLLQRAGTMQQYLNRVWHQPPVRWVGRRRGQLRVGGGGRRCRCRARRSRGRRRRAAAGGRPSAAIAAAAASAGCPAMHAQWSRCCVWLGAALLHHCHQATVADLRGPEISSGVLPHSAHVLLQRAVRWGPSERTTANAADARVGAHVGKGAGRGGRCCLADGHHARRLPVALQRARGTP